MSCLTTDWGFPTQSQGSRVDRALLMTPISGFVRLSGRSSGGPKGTLWCSEGTAVPAKGGNGARPVAAQDPAPSDGRPHRRLARGITGALISALGFIFSAPLEAYWLLDPDAKCRSAGLQTVGHVSRTESEEHEDPETGATSYTHYLTYRYPFEAGTYTTRKHVGSLEGVQRGDEIRVYYLPDSGRPDWREPKSAIDFQPRALGEQERRRLEGNQGRTEEGRAELGNGSEPR